jgi:hypothetical protein
VVSTHAPVHLSGAGRSTVAVGRDGIAILRNPYDLDDLARRSLVFLLAGVLTAAAANSLWPGQLDAIALALGIVLLAGLIPVVGYAIATLVAAVVGTAVAIARPRRTLKATKTVWRTARSDRVADVVAALDPQAVRAVVDRAEMRDVTAVRGWLRPTLDLALRSGRELRITAHPWWRRQLTRLAGDVRELCRATDPHRP